MLRILLRLKAYKQAPPTTTTATIYSSSRRLEEAIDIANKSPVASVSVQTAADEEALWREELSWFSTESRPQLGLRARHDGATTAGEKTVVRCIDRVLRLTVYEERLFATFISIDIHEHGW